MPTDTTEIIDKQKWIEDLANQVGEEVEKLVKAAPTNNHPMASRKALMAAIDVRKHIGSLYSLDGDEFHNMSNMADVFVGEIAAKRKVETYTQLKNMCNELQNIQDHPEYAGVDRERVVLVTGRLSANYVACLREVQVCHITSEQMVKTYLRKSPAGIHLEMAGSAFFADEPFGCLKGYEVLKAYNIVSFKIDIVTGGMLSWLPGHDPAALPVESLEHEYVKIV